MKIKSIRLKDFKRFTDLTVEELPESARLVVLVGPNGSGKSSLFEAFNVCLTQAQGLGATSRSSDNDYFVKSSASETFANWNASLLLQRGKVAVEFHDYARFVADRMSEEPDKKAFYIRSCYRHQADFSIDSIKRQGEILNDSDRPKTLNEMDSRVSNNYERLVATALTGLLDGSYDSLTGKEVRDRITGAVCQAVLRVLPDLNLTSTGDAMEGGTFYFQKGAARDWKYKNLSGGEKAAFDLVLDFVVKAQAFNNTVFCIDEPETHMHTSVQGALLKELLAQLPVSCQLWIATHSAGMMRTARDLYREHPGEVIFLDFGGHNFDEPVLMQSSTPDRAFWKRNFEVALGDLANLVAPNHIVFCEGGGQENGAGFDSQCYDTIFAHEFPDTEFVPAGSVSQLQKNSFSVSIVIERLLPGVQSTRVRDRDDCHDEEVEEWEAKGIRVLSQRSIENYLWDDEIIERLCCKFGQPEKVDLAKGIRQKALLNSVGRGNPFNDMKSAAGETYNGLKQLLQLVREGNTVATFSRKTLAPLVTPDTRIYQELKRDIFGDIDG